MSRSADRTEVAALTGAGEATPELWPSITDSGPVPAGWRSQLGGDDACEADRKRGEHARRNLEHGSLKGIEPSIDVFEAGIHAVEPSIHVFEARVHFPTQAADLAPHFSQVGIDAVEAVLHSPVEVIHPLV